MQPIPAANTALLDVLLRCTYSQSSAALRARVTDDYDGVQVYPVKGDIGRRWCTSRRVIAENWGGDRETRKVVDS